jgi:hypothetical protein
MSEKLRPCIVKGKKSFFHKWSEVSKIVDPSPLLNGHSGGVVRVTVGIVENEDNGAVHECYPYEIRFTDRNIGEPQEDISVV